VIYAFRKQNESNERLMSRFKKLVQRSRILVDTKKKRFYSNKPKKKFVRESAIMRTHYRKKRERERLAA
jgi:ribosomal protein S21